MTSAYAIPEQLTVFPRIPFDGKIDLTYRCNNNCRHCWVRIPHDAKEEKKELSYKEIKQVVDDARKLGCRNWSISGGEPMLRHDFEEIFDYITFNSRKYTINTNGTFITKRIAKLFKRKGSKMVALYGPTAEIHDHITRNPGSFEATMQGFRYLKEAGAHFIVQLIPMRDNYRGFDQMVELAKSLSPSYRIGSTWLYLSASGDAVVNEEIKRQRLLPSEIMGFDKPDMDSENSTIVMDNVEAKTCFDQDNIYPFASCIETRRDFHINPYGKMGFCSFINDPMLKYDLKKGSIKEGWERFIPSLKYKIKISKHEYLRDCGICAIKSDCSVCSVHKFLENRNYSEKISYMCEIVREKKKFRDEWACNNRRYYSVADFVVQVDSEKPFSKDTFHHKLKDFEIDKAKVNGSDVIKLTHYFKLPDLSENLGVEVYKNPPWNIYKKGNTWIYLECPDGDRKNGIYTVAIFDNLHLNGKIFKKNFSSKATAGSLARISTDQIWLARVLAEKQGCLIHSSGVKINNTGLLFVGHSEAGKSTICKMLKDKAKILCDDRIIVRKKHGNFSIYGTWCHGELPDVSSDSAPLKAVLFLNKSGQNSIERISDKKEISKRLLSCVVRPLTTKEWWEKIFKIIEDIADRVPCYMLNFDLSGKVTKVLENKFYKEVENEEASMAKAKDSSFN